MQAFWLFGLVSAFFGAIYSIFVGVFLFTKKRRNTRKQNWGKGDGQEEVEKAKELESFLESKASAPPENLRRDSPIGSSST